MATKSSTSLPRVELLHVFVPTGLSGRLAKHGQHSFTYDTSAIESRDPAAEISLTMPLSAQSYSTTPMLPVFQTFLPEGYLKERIQEKFAKTLRVDDMALLALSGGNAIGRLRVSRERALAPESGSVESLQEILADQGSRDLFEHLADTYLIQSGVGGVQPKVLLPASDDTAPPDSVSSPHAPFAKSSIGAHATLRGRQLIVKVSGPDYPYLTENEFHCLNIGQSLARSTDLVVPRFWLSADRRRLAIERFDYDRGSGTYSGFEDMVSLQGTVNERKYEGSYENVAKAIALNAGADHVRKSLREFFSMLALSMVLRNGDAHLKNFGLLYTNPGTDDCRLSPLYDVVCTTVYLEKDLPALTLAGARAWPDRKTLVAFGHAHCHVKDAANVIDLIIATVMAYRPDDESGIWQRMRNTIESGLPALAAKSPFGHG
jgi:serine/threonine-protein kinase HipA